MTKEILNKQEVRKEARQLLKQGMSRQETFEILKEKHKHTKGVTDILKNMPSQQAIQRYGKWNYVLLGLLLITAGIFFSATPSIGVLLWYGFLIYVVVRMLVKYYIWVTVLSAFTIIAFSAVLFIGDTPNLNWMQIVLMASVLIPTLILPIWLEKKLCPKSIERKEEYTNQHGQKRLKIVYAFSDL